MIVLMVGGPEHGKVRHFEHDSWAVTFAQVTPNTAQAIIRGIDPIDELWSDRLMLVHRVAWIFPGRTDRQTFRAACWHEPASTEDVADAALKAWARGWTPDDAPVMTPVLTNAPGPA